MTVVSCFIYTENIEKDIKIQCLYKSTIKFVRVHFFVACTMKMTIIKIKRSGCFKLLQLTLPQNKTLTKLFSSVFSPQSSEKTTKFKRHLVCCKSPFDFLLSWYSSHSSVLHPSDFETTNKNKFSCCSNHYFTVYL